MHSATGNLQALDGKQLCPCVVLTPDRSCRVPLPTCIACLGTGKRDRDREKGIARNSTRRIPTVQEFVNFDGGHCRQKYAELPSTWQCPGCGRNKYHLLRWTLRFPNSATPFEGWVVGLHGHHDHSADPFLIEGRVVPSRLVPRFQTTILCEQCNSADATAKRKLDLPKRFSYSPAEIRMFTTGTPHGWHLLDYDRALDVYAMATADERESSKTSGHIVQDV
jgi:hypothetical protein